MNGIDLHSVYNFLYPVFWVLPDLAIKVNPFDDLNKIGFYFIKFTSDVTLTIRTTYVDINEPGLR